MCLYTCYTIFAAARKKRKGANVNCNQFLGQLWQIWTDLNVSLVGP